MVAQLPLTFVLADTIYAAGLGILLAAAYTFMRMIFVQSKIWLFACDLSVFVIGTILYMSAVTARFYSGIVRWYTIFAVLLGYAVWQLAAHAKFIWLARLLKFLMFWPIYKIWDIAFKPCLAHIKGQYIKTSQKRDKKRELKRISKTKQLQKPSVVLYNSK